MPENIVKRIQPRDILDITPHVGHVHLGDRQDSETGVKTWKPVNMETEQGEEIKPLDSPQPSISELDDWYRRRLLGRPSPRGRY